MTPTASLLRLVFFTWDTFINFNKWQIWFYNRLINLARQETFTYFVAKKRRNVSWNTTNGSFLYNIILKIRITNQHKIIFTSVLIKLKNSLKRNSQSNLLFLLHYLCINQPVEKLNLDKIFKNFQYFLRKIYYVIHLTLLMFCLFLNNLFIYLYRY